jgi:uncharacterized protein YkwD
MAGRMKKVLPIVLLLALAGMAVAAAGASARGTVAAEVAPPEACPGQATPGLSAAAQGEAMLCMTNYARSVNGLVRLTASRPLGAAAVAKSNDILGCDEFSHEACSRPFTFWVHRYGYLKGCWKAAENIAWGTGEYSSVRAIFTARLESPEHHANILGPYREVGIGVNVGELEGNEGAAVWTQDFGSHKC